MARIAAFCASRSGTYSGPCRARFLYSLTLDESTMSQFSLMGAQKVTWFPAPSTRATDPSDVLPSASSLYALPWEATFPGSIHSSPCTHTWTQSHDEPSKISDQPSKSHSGDSPFRPKSKIVSPFSSTSLHPHTHEDSPTKNIPPVTHPQSWGKRLPCILQRTWPQSCKAPQHVTNERYMRHTLQQIDSWRGIQGITASPSCPNFIHP